MSDRLAEIKRHAESYANRGTWEYQDDIDWLVAEVTRLRGIETAAISLKAAWDNLGRDHPTDDFPVDEAETALCAALAKPPTEGNE